MNTVSKAKKQLKEARRRVDRAVGVDDRKSALESGVRTCQAETYIIRTECDARRSEFRREYEQSTNQRPPDNIDPTPIEGEISKSRGYFWGGVAAALLEIFFASLLIIGFGVDWRIAVVVSTTVTTLLVVLAHYAILFATRHKSRHVTLSRIKIFVLWPSLIVTAPAIAIVLLARTATGSWVISLLPLLQGAMWFATLGLILLGGSLFAAAEVLGWSAKAHAAFVKLLRVLTIVQNEMREFIDELSRLDPSSHIQSHSVSSPPRSASQLPAASARVITSIVAILVIGAATTACNSPALGTPGTTDPSAGKRDPVELHLEMDHSGSLNQTAWHTATASIREQLPAIIEAAGASRLTISYFADDGWVSVERLSLELPRLELPNVTSVEGGEAKLLPNIERSVAEHNAQERATAMGRALSTYRDDLHRTVNSISEDIFAYPSGAPAPCTDLYGAYRRAASMASGTRHAFIIVTDAYDSCGKLRAIPKPEGDVTVLTVLVAAGLGESKGVRSVDQYFERREVLRQVVPWVGVVPAFERNIRSYFGKAKQAEK